MSINNNYIDENNCIDENKYIYLDNSTLFAYYNVQDDSIEIYNKINKTTNIIDIDFDAIAIIFSDEYYFNYDYVQCNINKLVDVISDLFKLIKKIINCLKNKINKKIIYQLKFFILLLKLIINNYNNLKCFNNDNTKLNSKINTNSLEKMLPPPNKYKWPKPLRKSEYIRRGNELNNKYPNTNNNVNNSLNKIFEENRVPSRWNSGGGIKINKIK